MAAAEYSGRWQVVHIILYSVSLPGCMPLLLEQASENTKPVSEEHHVETAVTSAHASFCCRIFQSDGTLSPARWDEYVANDMTDVSLAPKHHCIHGEYVRNPERRSHGLYWHEHSAKLRIAMPQPGCCIKVVQVSSHCSALTVMMPLSDLDEPAYYMVSQLMVRTIQRMHVNIRPSSR
jgi:hypothetical protein